MSTALLTLLGVGGAQAVVDPAVVQASSTASVNNASGPQTITFASGLSLGSTVFVGAAVGSDNGAVSAPSDVITGITASGITFSRVGTSQLTTTKNGADLWVGTVTTAGATTLTVAHASDSHVTVGAIEAEPSMTIDGAAVTANMFNDATHDMGAKTFSSSLTGIEVGVLWLDPWGYGSSPTITAPSGWTTDIQVLAFGSSAPILWVGHRLLNGAISSDSPVITLSAGNANGQASIFAAYES